MLIPRIWNYFCGYVIITVKGGRVEEFINLAVENHIYLWDIEKLSFSTISTKISIKDFFKLRRILKITGSKINVSEKHGMPFKIRSIKKKKIFLFGLGALFVFLYFLSSYIWMIEISGQKSVSEEDVLKELNKKGFHVGITKRKIDKRRIENEMLIDMPGLTWIGIEIKGTKAYITVSERVAEPNYININEPCDIIALKNAVIDKIHILKGDGIVKDGDTVEKGQLLVTGIIERENSETRYVHSMAKVLARTWYEDIEEINLKQTRLIKTGRTSKIYNLVILDKKMIKKEIIPYVDYDKNCIERNLLSFGDYIFPLKLIITVYTELKPVNLSLTLEEAKERCIERLNGKIKLLYPVNAIIANKRIEFFSNDISLKGKIYAEIIEDIAEKKSIIIY